MYKVQYNKVKGKMYILSKEAHSQRQIMAGLKVSFF